MVRTRHSLPTPQESGDDLPANTESGEVPKWMRDLKIDGKETLKGEKKAARSLGVYTWRGAVYQIDDNTPREWIEAEADRHKKKEQPQKKQDAPARHKSETPASVGQFRNLKQKARTSVEAEEEEEEEEEESEQERSRPSKKKRQMEEGDREEEEEEEAVRLPKKPRKSLNSLKEKPAPPQRHYLFPTLHVKKKKKAQPKPKVDVFKLDPDVGAGERSREPTAHNKNESKKRRPNIDILPRPQQRPAWPAHSPELPEMPKSFTMPITERDKQTLSRIVCTITEPEANRLAATIVEIGKINSRAHQLQARSEGLIAAMTELKEKLLAKKKLDEEKQQQPAPPPPDSPMADQLTPPAEEPPRIISRMPSLSHDVPSERSASSPGSFDIHSLLNPAPNHGPTQPRWNLTSKNLTSLHLPPQPHDIARADKSRRDGETEQERWQRIRREVAILESLPTLLDNLPGASSSM
ncbi:hypothetical protein Slin15195_G115420 [Septoria linicola]|uniref:Uncharacterized protein n=1 Tax=Septoria linicola TaxID=215465 RepID=A0A9Q9B3E7_9PEZI|nr:hypothetical protein Slin15195_G115420 [Septoria linicola]